MQRNARNEMSVSFCGSDSPLHSLYKSVKQISERNRDVQRNAMVEMSVSCYDYDSPCRSLYGSVKQMLERNRDVQTEVPTRSDFTPAPLGLVRADSNASNSEAETSPEGTRED